MKQEGRTLPGSTTTGVLTLGLQVYFSKEPSPWIRNLWIIMICILFSGKQMLSYHQIVKKFYDLSFSKVKTKIQNEGKFICAQD